MSSNESGKGNKRKKKKNQWQKLKGKRYINKISKETKGKKKKILYEVQ